MVSACRGGDSSRGRSPSGLHLVEPDVQIGQLARAVEQPEWPEVDRAGLCGIKYSFRSLCHIDKHECRSVVDPGAEQPVRKDLKMGPGIIDILGITDDRRNDVLAKPDRFAENGA